MSTFRRGQTVAFKGYVDGMASVLVGTLCKVVNPKSGNGNRYVKVRLVNPPKGYENGEEFFFLPSELERTNS